MDLQSKGSKLFLASLLHDSNSFNFAKFQKCNVRQQEDKSQIREPIASKKQSFESPLIASKKKSFTKLPIVIKEKNASQAKITCQTSFIVGINLQR